MSRSYSRLIIYLRDVLLHTFISIRRHFGNQKGTEAERDIAIVSGIVTGVVTQLDNTQRSPWERAVFTVKNTIKTVFNGEMYTVTTVRSLIFNPCSVTKGR